MNLSDSMRFVLRHRGPALLSNFWKEDLLSVCRDTYREIVDLKHKSKHKIITGEWKDSFIESFQIIKIIPRRVNQALAYLREDLALEFESRTDAKDRSLFCIQVFRELLKFCLSTFSTVQSGGYLGLGKKRNQYTHLLMTRLIYRLSRSFILRFLDEVEGQMDAPEEKGQLRSFRAVLLDDSDLSIQKVIDDFGAEDNVRSIVENFKKYVLTGERG